MLKWLYLQNYQRKKPLENEVLPTIRKTGSFPIVQALTDIEERKLKSEERRIKVAELQILKDLMNSDKAKTKQCMTDEIINILLTYSTTIINM